MSFMFAGLATVLALAVAPQHVAAPPAKAALEVREDLTYRTGRHLRRHQLDLFLPRSERPAPLVMFVHGGTWTGGGKEHFAFVGRALAGHGFACAVINMRLFPFARPTAMVEDCRAALAWLHANAAEHGYDGERLFVMGHSSGAHLCSWLAFDGDALRAAGVPKAALRGAVLLSGVYEVRPRHAALDGVFGRDPERRRQASTWLHADAADPPTMIVWGDRDLPGFSLCARMLRDRLRAAQVPVAAWQCPGHDHTQTLFGLGQADDPVLPRVVQFLRGPTNVPAIPMRAASSVLWIADGARERAAGDAVAAALSPHGVEVLVRELADADGAAVAKLFRQLRRQRLAANAIAPTVAAGLHKGGLAVASAPLGRRADGLHGRFVASTALGPAGMRAAGRRPGQLDLGYLERSSLLSVYGDREPERQRRESWQRSAVLQQRGHDAHPVELPGTTAERALLALRADDDLLVPLLLAFVRG